MCERDTFSEREGGGKVEVTHRPYVYMYMYISMHTYKRLPLAAEGNGSYPRLTNHSLEMYLCVYIYINIHKCVYIYTFIYIYICIHLPQYRESRCRVRAKALLAKNLSTNRGYRAYIDIESHDVDFRAKSVDFRESRCRLSLYIYRLSLYTDTERISI